jgi:glutaredoxin 3
MAKEFLAQKGVPFVEKDVSRDRQAAQEMVRRSGQQGVPVTIVDGEIIVGYDVARLNQAVARMGVQLGVSVADAAKMKDKYHLSVDSGALVGNVKPGSPGQRAGIQPGDVIVEMAGYPIRTAQDVTDVLVRLKGAREVSLVWQRGERTMRATVQV